MAVLRKYRSNNPKKSKKWFTFCSKHVCFCENLSTTLTHTKRKDFGILKKSENYLKTTRFQDLWFLMAFFFAWFFRVFSLNSFEFEALQTFFAFFSPNPKTCNQSTQIEGQSSIYWGVLCKISRYRSNSENTDIFLGFGGSSSRCTFSKNDPTIYTRSLYNLYTV